MKRSLLLIVWILFTAMPLLADRVDPETAKKVATTFLNNNGAKATQLTDLTKSAGFPNLYIFNAEEGFVVMSADDCVKPILGYSLTGSFVAEGMPENISSWLQGYDEQIADAVKSGEKATNETSKEWKDLIEGSYNAAKATSIVEPLIQTQWNQGSPYNTLCPYDNSYHTRTVTGCVATAMAQIMRYWNYPSHGIGTHSYIPVTHPEYGEQYANFNSTNYDWNNMAYNYSNSNPNVEKQAVATLMYHCGVSVEMKYGPTATGGSGAPTSNVADALKLYFNYSSDTHYVSRSRTTINDDQTETTEYYYTDSEWIALLKNELNSNRPIQYQGSLANGTEGHSFVCDGYDSNDYFHFNWGWGGNCDAYYTINDLKPGPNGIGSGTYGIYNHNQGAIIGAHPSECTLDAPTNLSYSLDARDVTFSWTGSAETVRYNIYRNNTFIGSTSETSYTATAPFGDNIYYIRSVDSNGALSLSSNAVTVTIDYSKPVVNDLTAISSGNTATLSWTAPTWCYPEMPSETLTYGDGIYKARLGYMGQANMYWGHRFLANNLSSCKGMVIYKVSIDVFIPGTYECFLFKGTAINESIEYPLTQIAHASITPSTTGWFDIVFDEPVEIDDSQDLWVFIYDPEKKDFPAAYSDFSDHSYGCYFSNQNPTTVIATYDGIAWLIRTCLTDGNYTYNLYQDGVKIAENLADTNYSNVSLNADAANQFNVTTNYYEGEVESNMVGIAMGEASLPSLDLDSNNKMTVTEGSILTVIGTINNDNPANLVIEDGGQLISDAVIGTMKKEIDAYDVGLSNHWKLITSPVSNTDVSLATSGSYDLYAYDETENYWRNQKVTANNITEFVQGQGYLYANAEDKSLQFAGELNGSFSGIALSFAGNGNTKGYNLVGNPRAYKNELWIVDGNNAIVGNTNYVFINSDGDGFVYATTGNDGKIYANPLQGFFVQATATGQRLVDATVINSRDHVADLGGNEEEGTINLMLIKNGKQIDNAIVKLGEGYNLGKMTLNENTSKLYIPINQEEYAIVVSGKQGEMPVNIKVVENGNFTLSVSPLTSQLSTLHLIDNLTGEDIDLLATPSYTFEAKTEDYPSRFRLVFSTQTNESILEGGEFAFYANGQIIVPNMDETSKLQIIDMTGRIINDPHITTPGVYILQLITERETRTQKIIIK